MPIAINMALQACIHQFALHETNRGNTNRNRTDFWFIHFARTETNQRLAVFGSRLPLLFIINSWGGSLHCIPHLSADGRHVWRRGGRGATASASALRHRRHHGFVVLQDAWREDRDDSEGPFVDTPPPKNTQHVPRKMQKEGNNLPVASCFRGGDIMLVFRGRIHLYRWMLKWNVNFHLLKHDPFSH